MKGTIFLRKLLITLSVAVMVGCGGGGTPSDGTNDDPSTQVEDNTTQQSGTDTNDSASQGTSDGICQLNEYGCPVDPNDPDCAGPFPDECDTNDTPPADENHAPTATAQNATTDEDTAKTITLNGTDADGDTLTYTVTAQPSHGALSGTAPNLTYTPTSNYHGSDSFNFTVNDGTVDSTEAAVSITINSINDLPTTDAGSDKNITEGESVDLNGTGTDIDGTITSYEWSLDTNVSYEAFTPDITVAGLAEGNHTFTLTVRDNENGVGIDTVKVIVKPFTITHNGVTYGTVTSPYTGKVWLDRNLGASQVCTALDDTACYGDYYQWGRNTDGHEKSTSGTTTTQATDIDNAGDLFITSSSTYSNDWAYSADGDGSLRSANWSKMDGSSVCPVGFRVPTIDELKAELLDSGSAEIHSNADAFNSFLKLSSSGYRNGSSASLVDVGSWGYLGSSSVSGAYSSNLLFGPGAAGWTSNGGRAHGPSVRCLRD